MTLLYVVNVKRRLGVLCKRRFENIFRSFSTTEDVLKGVRHMVAMQIAHEPLVRQVIRDQLKERARLTCRPTKKGLKVLCYCVFNCIHYPIQISCYILPSDTILDGTKVIQLEKKQWTYSTYDMMSVAEILYLLSLYIVANR